jgi:hypothetical protein
MATPTSVWLPVVVVGWAPSVPSFSMCCTTKAQESSRPTTSLLPQCLYLMLLVRLHGFSVLAAAANDVNDVFPLLYGEAGNDNTCTAQGFFLQLAVTAIMYNTSLSSCYYLMSIVLGWRGATLKRTTKYSRDTCGPRLHPSSAICGNSLLT